MPRFLTGFSSRREPVPPNQPAAKETIPLLLIDVTHVRVLRPTGFTDQARAARLTARTFRIGDVGRTGFRFVLEIALVHTEFLKSSLFDGLGRLCLTRARTRSGLEVQLNTSTALLFFHHEIGQADRLLVWPRRGRRSGRGRSDRRSLLLWLGSRRGLGVLCRPSG